MSDKKELRFLIPLQKPPVSQRTTRASFYDDVLNEFIESNLEYAEVKELGKNIVTVTYSLRRKLKERNIENVKVICRKKENKVYLVRTE